MHLKNLCGPKNPEIITTNTNGRMPGGHPVDWVEVRTDNPDNEVGGGEQQNTRQHPQNDCLEFAAMVDNIANDSASDSTFVANLFRARNATPGITHFRGPFIDREGGSPNQARHVAGAIFFGYGGGAAALAGGPNTYADALRNTLNAFNHREQSYRVELVPSLVRGGATSRRVPLPRTQSQQADINLNAVAIPIGFSLGIGAISRTDIGNLIRSSICDEG